MKVILILLVAILIANLALSVQLHKNVGLVDSKINKILTESEIMNQKFRKYDEVYQDIKNKAIFSHTDAK